MILGSLISIFRFFHHTLYVCEYFHFIRLCFWWLLPKMLINISVCFYHFIVAQRIVENNFQKLWQIFMAVNMKIHFWICFLSLYHFRYFPEDIQDEVPLAKILHRFTNHPSIGKTARNVTQQDPTPFTREFLDQRKLFRFNFSHPRQFGLVANSATHYPE